MEKESDIVDGMSQLQLHTIAKKIPLELLNEVSNQFSGRDFDFSLIIKPTVIRSALVLHERRKAIAPKIIDLKPNDHVWAIAYGELLVAIFKSKITTHKPDCFYVCGPWEGKIKPADITIISVIERPETHLNTPLYY